MSSILICGEGAHDVGVKDWDSKTGSHVYLEGWLQPLLRKAINKNITVKAKRLNELISFGRGRGPKNLPKGHGHKAALARYIAQVEKCDVVVFMVDADTNDENERLVKVHEIEQGFSAINSSVSGVACVPKSASESWLLSDAGAWSSLGLCDISNLLPSYPEDIWGARNDPEDNHPKHAFARVAEAAGLENNRDTRNLICDASSLAVLKEKCPISLVQFINSLAGICP